MTEILEVFYHAVMESRPVRWLFIVIAMVSAYFFAPPELMKFFLGGLFALGIVMELASLYFARNSVKAQA